MTHECSPEKRLKRFANESLHVCQQCTVCGKRVGDWLRHSPGWETLPMFDEEAAERERRAPREIPTLSLFGDE